MYAHVQMNYKQRVMFYDDDNYARAWVAPHRRPFGWTAICVG